ncbi:iron ABC transporter permease, partial [Psychrobacter sp. 16-Bac2893]
MVEPQLSRSSAISLKPHIAKRPITRALLWCGLLVILLIGCWQGLTAYSKFALSLTDLLSLLTQQNGQASLTAQLLIEIRLPRVLVA